jgi:hypothetical protein
MRALMFALLIVSVAAGLAYALSRRQPENLAPRASADRPALLLLTSLPLVFGEQFSIEGGGSPALKALETRYRVVPISVTGEAELGKGGLLLMAQPRAQPAEDLVALDKWVRDGGRVLLLADPMLEWPSDRPLGDPFRPPTMFADTGLLAHWGLRLDAPDERGPKNGKVGGYEVVAVSPGSLSGACEVSRDRLVAHCRVGRGRATIVADADILDVDKLGEPARHNLDALLRELAQLERKRFFPSR